MCLRKGTVRLRMRSRKRVDVTMWIYGVVFAGCLCALYGRMVAVERRLRRMVAIKTAESARLSRELAQALQLQNETEDEYRALLTYVQDWELQERYEGKRG